jgi:hypothetical protein
LRGVISNLASYIWRPTVAKHCTFGVRNGHGVRTQRIIMWLLAAVKIQMSSQIKYEVGDIDCTKVKIPELALSTINSSWAFVLLMLNFQVFT